MEGIKFKRDPGNIQALTYLGYYALKSGQYEKAEQRFLDILKIDSTQSSAYYYLSQLYLAKSDTLLAIKQLKNMKKFQKDPEINYVKQLKNI